MKTFESSGDAYDATQCDVSIENGDPLVIQDEGVVGLAWTWPVAVTVKAGELHSVVGDATGVVADAGWTPEQIRIAVEIADGFGFPVADWARV
ncbi:hypothetical protein ACQKD8_22325 [Pseudomonas sp. NPDC077405]